MTIIDNIVKGINKEFGAGSMMRMDDPGIQGVEAIPTGSILLDNAIGIGGYPKGRIIEIYGGEASGKTTLALHFLAQFGENALFIDAEHALDTEYAKRLGVEADRILIAQPDYMELGLQYMDRVSGEIDAVVFDSIAGSPTLKETQGEFTDQDIGVKAKLMSRALRMLNPKISKSGCTVMFLNQTRDNIGPMAFAPKVRPGGNAMKFHSSLSLDVRRADKIVYNEEQIGHYMNIKVAKNKVAPPFKTCKVPIIYGQGISRETEILELAVDMKIVEKKGSWFSYKSSNIAQGMVNARLVLEDNPELAEEIFKELEL